ncbi:DUF2726 domain-containing protein [Neisseriaceae bacterium ESL0693]|nr:DUF2726 domain-containing protein [Neisseriaceae bacterium ESL0693]
MSANMVILCVVALCFILLMVKPKRSRSSKQISPEPAIWPFETCALMSIPERQLYWRLVEIFPDMIVLAQVQASRVLRVQQGQNVQYWFNRICRTSYDFVICDQDSFPIAVIELDDSSHDTAKRRADDARKNKALAGAGLKIIRLRVNRLPDDHELRRLILSA